MCTLWCPSKKSQTYVLTHHSNDNNKTQIFTFYLSCLNLLFKATSLAISSPRSPANKRNKNCMMNNLILKKRHFLGLLGDVALAGAKAHQKPLLVFWGQTVPEKSKENNLPLQCLHPYNFLPLSFDCQACLQDLYSGLRMYFKSPHHSVQFGTKHVCCYLGTSVGEI